MAKAAAIFVIALVLVAAVLVRPEPQSALLAARPLAMHGVALPGIALPSRPVAEATPKQSRRRGATRANPPIPEVVAASAFEQPPTVPAAVPALDVRPVLAAADQAPTVVDIRPVEERGGHVSRAFATAAHHTSGALRTAGRALRSVF